MPDTKTAKPKAGGSGLQKRVMGMPLWVWIAAAAGGLLIGVYLRSRSASSSAASTGVDPNAIDPATGIPYGQEQQAALAGAGASPSDNGLGSSSTDLSGFMASEQSAWAAIDQDLQALAASVQNGANFSQGVTAPSDGGGGPPVDQSTGLPYLGTLGMPPAPSASLASFYSSLTSKIPKQPTAPKKKGTVTAKKTTTGGWQLVPS